MEQATFDRVNEERRELISEIVTSVLSQVIPRVRQELTTGYLDQITTIVNRRFDELDSATEARHSEFVKQTEERFASTATKEELAGVTKAGAENTGRIDRLEASTDARLKLLEDGIKALNESDKQHKQEIKDIKLSATKTADNAQKTSEAVMGLIDKFEQWKAESTRELNAVKDAQKADEKALRNTQEDVLSNRAELNDIKTTVATETDKARSQIGVMRDKVDVMLNVQHAHDEKFEAMDMRQQTVENKVEKYGAPYRAVSWLVDKHPRVGGAIFGTWFFSQLAALYLLFHIASAGIAK